MADEKRIKLGVDIGELGNQLLQINNLVEKNYSLAIQGQERYNTILETSIKLLDTQSSKIQEISDLLEKAGNASQNLVPNIGGQNQIMPLPIGIGGGGTNNSSNEGNNTADLDTFHDDVLDKFDKLISKTGSIEAGVDLILDPFVKIQEDVSEILNEIRNPGSGGGGGSAGGRGGSAGGNSSNSGASGGGNNSLNSLGNGFNRTAGIAMQQNDLYMLAAATAAIPFVGQGVSMVIQKLLKSAEKLDNSTSQFYAVTGEYAGDELGEFNNIGLSTAEAYLKKSQYARSNANYKSSDLSFEKGFGLDEGTMSSLLRSTRNDVSSDLLSSGQIGAKYLSYLTASVAPKQVRSYSDEYLKILVDINQQQLEQVGYTNSLVNGKIIQGIAKLDDSFQNPAVLQKVVSGLQSGLQNANSPQMEALQFMTLSQINPNASLHELQKMKENPFSSENLEYLNQMLKNLDLGDENLSYFNVARQFNISNTLSERILKGARAKWEKGEMFYGTDFKDIQKQYDIEQEAINSTSIMQRSNAKTEDVFAKMGTPMMEAMDSALSKMGEGLKSFNNFLNSMGLGSELLGDLAKILSETNSNLSNFNQNLKGESNPNSSAVIQRNSINIEVRKKMTGSKF